MRLVCDIISCVALCCLSIYLISLSLKDDEESKEEKEFFLNIRNQLTDEFIGIVKIREYFVRTNYIGKLKNSNLISDFKEELKEKMEVDFTSMKNDILNYNNIERYEQYKQILEKYELKQIILNQYNEK